VSAHAVHEQPAHKVSCCNTGGVHPLQRLASWLSEGGLAGADAVLLQLVVPICLQQLWSALQQQQLPAEHSHTLQPAFCQVWRVPTIAKPSESCGNCRQSPLLVLDLLDCHWLQVLTTIATYLSRQEAERRLPPLLSAVFRANSAVAAVCQMACAQPDVILLLALRLGPQAYLTHIHPPLLLFLCSGRAPSLCQAGGFHSISTLVHILVRCTLPCATIKPD
jgi:hypothetical protein